MDPLRVAVIAIMAFVILALAPFLETGTFVLPFGLFMPAFFIIAVAGLIIQSKKPGLSEYIALIWTFGLCVSSKFVADIFLNESTPKDTKEIYLTAKEIIKLIVYLLLLLWIVLQADRTKTIWKWLQIIGGLGILCCLFLEMSGLLIIPTLLWFAGVLVSNKTRDTHYALAVFFTFLVLAGTITGYFFGAEAIILQL